MWRPPSGGRYRSLGKFTTNRRETFDLCRAGIQARGRKCGKQWIALARFGNRVHFARNFNPFSAAGSVQFPV